MTRKKMDSREFRDAMGAFSTGVTVITALADNGQPIGLTVNSFNSLSLEPALILWSLSKDSPNFKDFLGCKYFAVNILAKNQRDISNQFSTSNREAYVWDNLLPERFAGIDWYKGKDGVPLLPDCLATLECRNSANYVGGDHHILIGEVSRFQCFGGQPLIFYRGKYRALSDED